MKTTTNRVLSAVPTGLLGAALCISTSTLAEPGATAAPVSLTLKGQWPGYARGPALDVAIQGQYAYLAASGAGLVIVDVTDPANPMRVGGVDTSGSALDVAVAGNYAYVADGDAGLQVIDVSNPANPVQVGGYDTSRRFVSDVAVVGDLIYVANGEQGLLILEQSRALWLEVSGRNPFTISLSGEPGTAVRLQRSSNLRDWEDWQSATLSDAPLEFPDPDATGTTNRFYRAVKQ